MKNCPRGERYVKLDHEYFYLFEYYQFGGNFENRSSQLENEKKNALARIDFVFRKVEKQMLKVSNLFQEVHN